MYLNNKKALLNLKKALIISNLSLVGISIIPSITPRTHTFVEIGKISSIIPRAHTFDIIYNKDYELSNEKQIEIKVLENKYNDCSCPLEWQDYIFEKCKEYDIPDYIVMTIIDQESNGTWATNGVISITNDYGVSQINLCNLGLIEEVFGYTKDDILNDPYKNIEAAIYLIKNIINMSLNDGKIDIENVFGMYNGWINWRNIEDSVKYTETCMTRLEDKFSRKIDENKVYTKEKK